jgi:hypothetical protein
VAWNCEIYKLETMVVFAYLAEYSSTIIRLQKIPAVKLHVIKYKEWNLGLSLIAYLIIFSLYIGFLKVGKTAIRQYKRG